MRRLAGVLAHRLPTAKRLALTHRDRITGAEHGIAKGDTPFVMGRERRSRERVLIPKGRRPLQSPFKGPRPLKIPRLGNAHRTPRPTGAEYGIAKGNIPFAMGAGTAFPREGTYSQGGPPLEIPVQGTTSLENPAVDAPRRHGAEHGFAKGRGPFAMGAGTAFPRKSTYPKGRRPLEPRSRNHVP